MLNNGSINLAKALYRRFCKVYGKIIGIEVVVEFLNQLHDLREVNERYVDFLYDYAVDFYLVGC